MIIDDTVVRVGNVICSMKRWSQTWSLLGHTNTSRHFELSSGVEVFDFLTSSQLWAVMLSTNTGALPAPNQSWQGVTISKVSGRPGVVATTTLVMLTSWDMLNRWAHTVSSAHEQPKKAHTAIAARNALPIIFCWQSCSQAKGASQVKLGSCWQSILKMVTGCIHKYLTTSKLKFTAAGLGFGCCVWLLLMLLTCVSQELLVACDGFYRGPFYTMTAQAQNSHDICCCHG